MSSVTNLVEMNNGSVRNRGILIQKHFSFFFFFGDILCCLAFSTLYNDCQEDFGKNLMVKFINTLVMI